MTNVTKLGREVKTFDSDEQFSAAAGNHEEFFRRKLDDLHEEGRYRVFADLERNAGQFPKASTKASTSK